MTNEVLKTENVERNAFSSPSSVLGKRKESPNDEAELKKPAANDAARLSTEFVHIIGQGLPHTINLTEPAAAVLAPDAEYRLREIIQDSVKFMKHSKRSRLVPEDINAALRLRNVAPIYGFGRTAASKTPPALTPLIVPNGKSPKNRVRIAPPPSGGPLHFANVEGASDLFFTADTEVNIKSLVETGLPPLPLEVTVAPHWLAINGVQPAIPQNPLPRSSEDGDEDGMTEVKTERDDSAKAEILPVVKHVLSKELQLYFDDVNETLAGDNALRIDACLASIAEEPGLVQLLPYFTLYVRETVQKSLKNLPMLLNSMRLVRALLSNPNFQMESYLHQLLPTILSCIVAKRLYSKPRENHWKLRDFAARILHDICYKYRDRYPHIQSRVTKTLIDAFRDPHKSLTTHYGAIMGLACLGKHVVDGLLIPHMGDYINLVKKVLDDPQLKTKSIRRYEAGKVMGALGFALATSAQSHKKANAVAASSLEVFKPDFTNISRDLLEKLPSDFVSCILAVEKEFGRDIYPQQSNDKSLESTANNTAHCV